LFFTGKGGVGKMALACDRRAGNMGFFVLLVSLCALIALTSPITAEGHPQGVLLMAAIGVRLNPAVAFAVALPLSFALQRGWLKF
jgi:hypothetical protein